MKLFKVVILAVVLFAAPVFAGSFEGSIGQDGTGKAGLGASGTADIVVDFGHKISRVYAHVPDTDWTISLWTYEDSAWKRIAPQKDTAPYAAFSDTCLTFPAGAHYNDFGVSARLIYIKRLDSASEAFCNWGN